MSLFFISTLFFLPSDLNFEKVKNRETMSVPLVLIVLHFISVC
jgi:hypothetical protein